MHYEQICCAPTSSNDGIFLQYFRMLTFNSFSTKVCLRFHRWYFFSEKEPFSWIYLLKVLGDIRVRIPQKLDVVAFWSWNLDVVAFQACNLDIVAFYPLKKCIGITMSWLSCLRFSMSWCFSPRIWMLRFFGPGILMSWFLSWNPDAVVYVQSNWHYFLI